MRLSSRSQRDLVARLDAFDRRLDARDRQSARVTAAELAGDVFQVVGAQDQKAQPIGNVLGVVAGLIVFVAALGPHHHVADLCELGGRHVSPDDRSVSVAQPYVPALVGPDEMARRIADPASHRPVDNLVQVSELLTAKTRAMDFAWDAATVAILFAIAGLAFAVV